MPYMEAYQELYHHGVVGQKWGVRRYQYEDGSLTPAGKIRYAKLESSINQRYDEETRSALRVLEKNKHVPDDAKSNRLKKKEELAKITIDRADKLYKLRKEQIDSGLEYFENKVEADMSWTAFMAGAAGALAMAGSEYLDQRRLANKGDPTMQKYMQISQEYKEKRRSVKEKYKGR